MEDIDLKPLERYIQVSVPEHFVNAPGTEAYALYARLSAQLPAGSKVADLGTLQGLSALALSYNPEVQVYSYDITQNKNIVEKSNIEFTLANCFDCIDDILQCDLILVDVDPHDGIQEQSFFDILVENNYKGIVLWDDIHLNSAMESFWNNIKIPKEDVSVIGHHSGTGKITFN